MFIRQCALAVTPLADPEMTRGRSLSNGKVKPIFWMRSRSLWCHAIVSEGLPCGGVAAARAFHDGGYEDSDRSRIIFAADEWRD